jgi:3-oxoacyl-[acyl-carrier-protein] synthase II
MPIITGIGLATPLGVSAAATWDALCAGRAIVDHARVPGLDESPLPRTHRLALRVAREAIAHAGWSPGCTSGASSESTALVVGTSKGPVETWLRTASPGNSRTDFGLADIAAYVAAELNLHDSPRLTLSAACASGLHAMIRAAMMIRAGELRRAIVIGVESSVHPLFIGSFRRLGVLPPEGGCRPFDQHRAGFLVSEAAAAVCLESGEDAGLRAIVRIDRFAMGGDAEHITGIDPSGQTVRRLLSDVVNEQPVDLFHAHGTATEANDPVELAAIEHVVDSRGRQPAGSPHIYSHKGALGHSLGAAGLVSVAINCLSHQTGIVPPNVRTTCALPTHRTKINQQLVHRPIHRSIATAAGFGGPIAVVGLSSVTK